MVASTYKILLEQTADGQSSATVLGLPDCHVIALTPRAAINQVQTCLTERLANAEVIFRIYRFTKSVNRDLSIDLILMDSQLVYIPIDKNHAEKLSQRFNLPSALFLS